MGRVRRFALALLLWQYARRNTTLVRVLAFALAAFGLGPSVLPPKAIAQANPATQAPAKYPEIALAFVPERGRLGHGGASGERNKVQVDIPIQLSGPNPDLLYWQIAAITITPEGGEPWSCR